MNSQEVVAAHCPYCGETIRLLIDCSVAEQSYIEDCEVCCRPMDIRAECDNEGVVEVQVLAEFE